MSRLLYITLCLSIALGGSSSLLCCGLNLDDTTSVPGDFFSEAVRPHSHHHNEPSKQQHHDDHDQDNSKNHCAFNLSVQFIQEMTVHLGADNFLLYSAFFEKKAYSFYPETPVVNALLKPPPITYPLYLVQQKFLI